MPAGWPPRRHRQAVRPHARRGPSLGGAGQDAAASPVGLSESPVRRGLRHAATTGGGRHARSHRGLRIAFRSVPTRTEAGCVARAAGEPDWGGDPPALYGTLTTPEGARPVPTIPSSYARYYENVRDAVRGTAPLAVTPEQALDVMRGLELAVASSQQRRVLPWTS